MASFNPSILVLLSFATLIAISSRAVLAQDETPVSDLETPPSPFPTFEPLQQCWLSIEEIVGCYSEVYRAFIGGKLFTPTIGPSCCLAINDITSNCWAKMFPNTPSFPPLLKSYCKGNQPAQPEPEAPTPSVEPADAL